MYAGSVYILKRRTGHEEAVKASQQSVTITLNQYRAGTASYLNVIIAQAADLSNERTAADILGRRLTAYVLLVKALGGGWDASSLKAAAGDGERGH